MLESKNFPATYSLPPSSNPISGISYPTTKPNHEATRGFLKICIRWIQWYFMFLRKLVWCPVYKAASTSWISFLPILSSYRPSQIKILKRRFIQVRISWFDETFNLNWNIAQWKSHFWLMKLTFDWQFFWK